MKTITSQLAALLATGEYLMADLYTFTLVNGTILRYNSSDIELTVAGVLYTSLGPRVSRGLTRQVIGTQVDSLEVTLYPDTTDLAGGMPILSAVAGGAFDNAAVVLARAFLPTWGDAGVTAGTIQLFAGNIADADFGRTHVKFTIYSLLQLLDTSLPKNLWQPACSHTLYDGGCSLLKANYTTSGAVTALVPASPTLSWYYSGLTQPYQYYNGGIVTYTGGANIGISRPVQAYNGPGYALTLVWPLPYSPAIGDTFTIYPGCDLSQGTCTNKFNNLSNYKGFPFVPAPNTTY